MPQMVSKSEMGHVESALFGVSLRVHVTGIVAALCSCHSKKRPANRQSVAVFLALKGIHRGKVHTMSATCVEKPTFVISSVCFINNLPVTPNSENYVSRHPPLVRSHG